MNVLRIVSICLLGTTACVRAGAADLIVYDEASRNGFDQNCTFGGVPGDFDFANAGPVHTGNASIRFTPETYNAVSWCTPSTLSTTAYRGLSLWVNGGAVGGQDLQLLFGLSGTAVASASVASLYGQALPANTWVNVSASFDAGAAMFNGSFDQISLQSNTNSAQSNVYLDDVSLLGRTVVNDTIFANGFEPGAFRGTNLAGMELGYTTYGQATGPIANTNYPVYDTRVIDYYASKHMSAFRFFFSWDAMQPHLYDAIPYADGANYQAYFDHYKSTVDYATSLGIGVIVEPWQANASGGVGGAMWRGNLVGSAAVPTAAFVDFWTKMANVFKDNPRVSYGLINEPNSMSTMAWFASAQAAINAIRSTGSTQRIYVPGNGYTGAGSWTASWYDTAPTQRSNAYGWLNANGPGLPITDPEDNLVAEIHCYLDADASGSTTGIVAFDTARQRLGVAVDEAAAHGYRMYLGEMGFYAGNPIATQAWTDFLAYFDAHTDTLIGYTWWAGGMPGWWDDVAATGGGHFSITPTNGATFNGDSVNMDMIEGGFAEP